MFNELKNRLLVILVSLSGLMCVFWFGKNRLFYLLRSTLGESLIELSMIDSVEVLMDVILLCSLVLIVPLICLQAYLMVCQGLLELEQVVFKKFVLIYFSLFLVGVFVFKGFYINLQEIIYSFKGESLEKIVCIENIRTNYKLLKMISFNVLLLFQLPLLAELLISREILDGIKLLGYRKGLIMLFFVLLLLIGSGVVNNVFLLLIYIVVFEIQWLKIRLKELCHN